MRPRFDCRASGEIGMDSYEWVNATDIKGTLAVGSSRGLWVPTLAGVIGGSRGCATGRYLPHCARFREERATCGSPSADAPPGIFWSS